MLKYVYQHNSVFLENIINEELKTIDPPSRYLLSIAVVGSMAKHILKNV